MHQHVHLLSPDCECADEKQEKMGFGLALEGKRRGAVVVGQSWGSEHQSCWDVCSDGRIMKCVRSTLCPDTWAG